MEKKESKREVSLKDLFALFLRNWWIILLTAIVAVGAVFAVKTVTYTPQYQSVAKLYILKQKDDPSSNASSDDFNLALKVVKDCNNLIKGHSVLDKVIEELQLDMTYNQLYGAVEVSNPSDTRILTIKAVSDTPEKAKQIVDKIGEIGTAEIEKAMGFKQVNFYEYGILDSAPCNTTSITFYAIVGVGAAVLCYGVFLLIFLLDDRIHSFEEFEQAFDLVSLGEVPNIDNNAAKRRFGYHSYYRGYYKNSYRKERSKYYRQNQSEEGKK